MYNSFFITNICTELKNLPDMRQRAVNEKAVEKTILFLKSLRENPDRTNITYNQRVLGISTGTYSAIKKLGLEDCENLITKSKGWLHGNVVLTDRDAAIVILEFLRQRQKKEVDNPIEPLWVPEMTAIKELLVEIRDNIKKLESGSNGLKIAANDTLPKREQIALSILQGLISEGVRYQPNDAVLIAFELADQFISASQ